MTGRPVRKGRSETHATLKKRNGLVFRGASGFAAASFLIDLHIDSPRSSVLPPSSSKLMSSMEHVAILAPS